MQNASETQSPGRRLGSWKEIAAFFESDESTVRRWEKERGLPIHRVPGGTGTKVFAYTDELTGWLERPRAELESPAVATRRQSAAWVARLKVRATILIAVGIVCATLAILLAVGVLAPRPAHAPGVTQTSARGAGRNVEAAAFYRAGLYEWQTRTPAGLARAVDDFTQAIVHDPGYAEAYAGLANCYNLLREFSTMPPEEAYPRAKAAAERAIALNPSLGDAHADLAFVNFYWSRDVAGARREFARALALEPRSAVAHHWYATFLMTIGRFPAALREIETAQSLDSESTAVLADKALILFYLGRPEEAVTLLQQLNLAQPTFLSTHLYLARIYLARGDNAGFLRELKADAAIRHDMGTESIAVAGEKGFTSAGRAGMFESMLDVQKRLYSEGRLSAYALASTYANLDDDGDATAWLKLSLSRHEADTIALAVDPSFARLRKSSRLHPLLAQAGLPSGS